MVKTAQGRVLDLLGIDILFPNILVLLTYHM